MICTACHYENPAGSAFCEECGARLERCCPSCASPCGPAAKFCRRCGASLAPPAAEHADSVVRKVVTIVFADLIGSTALHERLDPESVSRLMERYHRTVRGPIEAHGGTVVQLLGDGVMCAFGVPRVAEDDAIRAVRAAVAVQEAFRAFAEAEREAAGDLALRVAVNTGEVVVSDEHPAGIGDPLNVAARLQQEARAGDVLLGEATQRLVGTFVTLDRVGVLALKGRAETVVAYRVVSLDRPAGSSTIPFVGREDELRRLLTVYESAVTSRRARLAVILGSPGLGKSRLMEEVVRRLADTATLLTAQCDATGGATFAPIARALRTHLRLDEGAGAEAVRAAIAAVAPGDEGERDRISDGIAALLSGVPASPEETFFVIRRLLTALAVERPVILTIDDLQSAEPLLLDLAEHLVQWSTSAPLFLLAAARPELHEARSSLVAPGGAVAEVVTLTGLDAGAATRLAANVIGADELPAAVAGRVLAASEGNPLFVGELVRMLVHDGALRREGERWTTGVELARLEMPPTVQALLAARIERLRPEERIVLERAAIVGRRFSRAAVTHLLPPEIADLDARLEALRRSELVEPDTGWYLGEPALRFHHALIRDAAYRRVLKNTRAELHARVAGWLEHRVGGAVEHDETIGWHLEQAHQSLRELGPLDEHGLSLGERASHYLAAAGRRALARDDLPLAASLLGRALERLGAADATRADLALDWCEALLAAGDVGPAAGAIDELARFTAGSARLRGWYACFAGQLAVLTDPQSLRATADSVARAAETLAADGDVAGEAKAHSVHALALARLGQVGAAEAALDQALTAARCAGDRRRANAVLAGAPLAALWGPGPVTRASGRCLDVVRVLRITQGAPAVEAVALRCQALLEALRGRPDAARRMIASSRHLVEELGITPRLLEADVFAGRIELLEGDAVAAERWLRGAFDGLRALGLGIDAAQAAALLGRALLAQGRSAEAEHLSHESEALAGDDLQAAIAWRGVRAEALAQRGQADAAVALARAAVGIAAATDALLDHADARLALAAALHAAGRPDEAAAEEARAVELWEAKGATVLAERARHAVGGVKPAARTPDDRGRPARPVPRRVGPNAATAHGARLDAAAAARDADVIDALLTDEAEALDHTTGTVWDRRGIIVSWRSLLHSEEPRCHHEPLATLGDALALCRLTTSARGFSGTTVDVGAFQREVLNLLEVDERARLRRGEVFAVDHLGEAVVRLYERHAELLPAGPARHRVAATARSVAALLGPLTVERTSAALDPNVYLADHRPLGLPASRGPDALLQGLRFLLDVAGDVATRCDDVLGLGPDAFLLHVTNVGSERTGGGPFERPFLLLGTVGAAGLLTHLEFFAADRDDEAIARFDELTAGPSPERMARRPMRRVRPNAATADAARLEAAVASRDAEAVAAAIADSGVVIDHTAGVTYDRQARGWLSLLRHQHPVYTSEPLATLGDSLALCRERTSARGAAGAKFDVGAWEHENVRLIEVDAEGRRRCTEVFAADRLVEAIARLYERYAEVLPEGPARAHAASVSRVMGMALGPFDADRYESTFAASIEAIDHRTLGTWFARGPAALREHFRSMQELTRDVTMHIVNILDLRPAALLINLMHRGTARDGGGAYERPSLMLWVFDDHGLIRRAEWFDTDREAEALARFDALTTAPRPAPIENAATRWSERLRPAFEAGDWPRMSASLARGFRRIDRRTVVNASELDRDAYVAWMQATREIGLSRFAFEQIATRGERLELIKACFKDTGGSAGPSQIDSLAIVEVDDASQLAALVVFDPDDLDAAYAELDDRYDAGEAATHRQTAASRAFRRAFAARDWDTLATLLAPDLVVHDHRILGWETLHGPDAYIEALRSLVDLAPDTKLRIDHVELSDNSALYVPVWVGTRDGGAFETPSIFVAEFDDHGRIRRFDQYDIERLDLAQARFAETRAGTGREPAVSPVARRVHANAATTSAAFIEAAVAARDLDAIESHLAPSLEVVDHNVGLTYDREGSLATWRGLLRAQDGTYRIEQLASLGDALALGRQRFRASALTGARFDVGPYEIEHIAIAEVDEHGRRRRTEIFAADRLGDAVVRFYERYAELLPEGSERKRAAGAARSLATQLGRLDLDRLASMLAPDGEYVDHRVVGFGAVHGQVGFRAVLGTLFEAADDLTNRFDDVLALSADGCLVRVTNTGTDRASGGNFDRVFLMIWLFGPDGLTTRLEQFDVDRGREALARFGQLVAEPDDPTQVAAAPVRTQAPGLRRSANRPLRPSS